MKNTFYILLLVFVLKVMLYNTFSEEQEFRDFKKGDPVYDKVWNQVLSEMKFNEWNNKIKIKGKSIKNINFTKKDFKIFPENDIDITTSKKDEFSAWVKNVGIFTIKVCADSSSAKEVFIDHLCSCSASPSLAFSMAKENTDLDIGDVCFYGRAINEDGNPTTIWFFRNNCSIRILYNIGKQNVSIVELAKIIDEKLLKMLQ